MKKGISAVVSTILLLLLVIAVIGLAFGFFQNFFTLGARSAEQELQSTAGQIQQAARIESVSGNQLAVRNSGSQNLQASQLTVYVNNALQSCTWSRPTIPPAETATCALSSPCSSGATIRVNTPGGFDEKSCT